MGYPRRLITTALIVLAAVTLPVSLTAFTGIELETLDEGSDGPIGAAQESGTWPRSRPDEPAPPEAVPAPDEAVPAQPLPPEPVVIPDVDARWPDAARASGGVVGGAQVIAYYGHPFSRFMGILGETPIADMAQDLKARAAEYDEINGDIGVAPAFHLIYGTVWEDARVGILRESALLEYIEFAAQNDLLVFLDHQIGNGTVAGAIQMMLPYLRYPHVHLAIDPEWATDRPGQVIGGITAGDLNLAQQMIQSYLEREGLPGPRMLVVHQFNWRMIENREQVRSDFPLVQLIHNADGFGPPAHKRDSWDFNVLAGNMPLKGFKLFFPKSWRDGGYDDPLMTPAEVLQLEPVPVYIQYQ
jgi:hypothetical protein